MNPPEKKAWARLYKKSAIRRTPTRKQVVLHPGIERHYFDIFSEEFHFGRDPAKCEYVVGKNDGLEQKWVNRVSKIHFVIFRDKNIWNSPVLIKDLSRNGTFLNGELIGQNQVRLIKNSDVISIVEESIKIFDFRDFTTRDNVDLPMQVQKAFFVSNKLGSGAFGEVYKLYDKKMNPLAVKHIKAGSVKSRDKHVTENEIQIMKRLKHVCIIETIDIIKDPSGGTSLIIEYMDGGDLLRHILACPNARMTEDQSRCVLFQISDAVRYLHSKGVTHRDIKPDNVLLKDDSHYTLVKLTDFGLSKMVTESTVMKSLLGTPTYVAPEIIKPDVFRYTNAVDVWSMGVMLFAMISGTLPFSEDYGDIQAQIISGRYEFLGKCWQQVSKSAMNLISRMLVVQPEYRIKINEIFDSQWMSPHTEGIIEAKKIMDRHGGRVRIRSTPENHHTGKENEFAVPAPPPKRARYHL